MRRQYVWDYFPLNLRIILTWAGDDYFRVFAGANCESGERFYIVVDGPNAINKYI